MKLKSNVVRVINMTAEEIDPNTKPGFANSLKTICLAYRNAIKDYHRMKNAIKRMTERYGISKEDLKDFLAD